MKPGIFGGFKQIVAPVFQPQAESNLGGVPLQKVQATAQMEEVMPQF